MALTFGAYPPPATSSTAVNPAKLRDEIHRLSQRLVRSRESYNQDLLSGDPEVPLDEQLAVIESYRARLETATEQLRQHDAGEVPGAEVPEQPSPVGAQQPAEPEVHRDAFPDPRAPQPQPQAQAQPQPQAQVAQPQTAQAPAAQPEAPQPQVPQPEVPQPQAPVQQAAPTGPGIANPDGTPLLGDGGTILRTEDAAMGEYVRHAADRRWLTATGRYTGEFDTICDGILAALAHKHGWALEDERQQLVRQVDARYRRDYG